MGIRAVIRKGFGHGRIFGVHNPFDLDIGKAWDLHINLNILSRIPRSENKDIQKAVKVNIISRIKNGMQEKELNNVIDLFSHSRKIMRYIIESPNATEMMIAKVISLVTKRSMMVPDSLNLSYMKTKGMIEHEESNTNMKPIGLRQTMPQVLETHHFEYLECDIKSALELISDFDWSKKYKILDELFKINPELAGLMRGRI